MPRNSFGTHSSTNKRGYGLRLISAGLVALPAALVIAGISAAGPSHAQLIVGNTDSGSPLPPPSPFHAQVLTSHNNNQRTGVNPFEGPDPVAPTRLPLTPANVKAGFGKLWQHVVDGPIYAQPLFVSDLTVRNVFSLKPTTHKGVVFVATANNSIYAFDADDNKGANAGPLWFVNFNFLAQNISPVPGNAIIDLNGTAQTDIQPVIGIIGTPVIDPTTSTLYVLVRTQEFNDYVHRLHAIDITTGQERFNSPINVYNSITGDIPSVPGTGDGTDGNGNVLFDPLFENQRPALTLWTDPAGVKNSMVLVSYGSTENIAPYHGWMLGYDTTNLTLVRTFNSSPNATFTYVPGDPPVGGGFDQSGVGPAIDAAGNIYTSTGLGTFDRTALAPGSNSEFGESILRLDPATLTVADYFTPFDYQLLNSTGADLGAGAVVVLPDSAAVKDPNGVTHTHLLAAAGNEGKFYLLDRDNLGKIGSGSDTGILYSRRNSLGAVFGAPAYFNGQLFYHAAGDVLRTFKLNKTYPYITDLTPTNPTTPVYDFPGAIPSISANGTASAIIWEIEPFHPGVSNPILDPNQAGAISVLRAYDATDTTKPLWSSSDAGGRDTGGPYVKFSVPTVANGKVFVGGDGVLTAYGLIAKPAPSNGLHYVISGPVLAAGYASGGQYLIANVPTLTPNIKYDFSVTAVGANGKPIRVTQTVSVSAEGGTVKLPQTSVKFNNSSNATFTTNFPYVGSLFNLVVSDAAGNSSLAWVQTGFHYLGFDHYVLRAPLSVRSGQLTTILVTGATLSNSPTPLPTDTVTVYDTLPAGTQPYDINPNNGASFGLLPDDNDGFLATGQVPAATSTTGFAYEFQWGGGDFDVLPAFEGDTTLGFNIQGGQLTAGIPVRLYGVGKHIIVINNNGGLYLSPLGPPVTPTAITWGTLGNPFGNGFPPLTATAIVNVIP